ncbi:activity-regulated cytoskeleton associated protein 1-like [Episyrphus balteatus]|uniref:activity-regulated cytoskeleton associated protein 1-like n=1 Tax=Episyrphus balteatus TaxID=286459 RepID=UPI002486C9C4|nr:activity-regulated cytoskeleton associated protein 1-like [Episyrphus balteatus]
MSLVQMTTEQLQQLIEAVKVAAIADNPVASAPAPSKGSFTNCGSRFGGERDHYAVEEFITSVETFKDIEHIKDEDALRGISLLFYDLASTWWQGVKREAKTWNDAVELIRSHFAPTKPAYQIYMEIFQHNQGTGIGIDTFVLAKRALLAQLPEGRHNEESEIDLIYGLLNVDYRKHIARHDVKTFKDLLEKARIVEHNDTETFEDPAPKPSTERGSGLGGRNRCSYCSYRGHTIENCRKKKSAEGH